MRVSLGQLTIEGCILREEMAQNGYALLDSPIGVDVVEALISAYADFTDNLPDPEIETMDRMISDATDLDALDYSQDKQPIWHKYRTNHPQYAKPGGYANRSLQIATLRSSGRDTQPDGQLIEDDPKEYFHFHTDGLVKMQSLHSELDWGSIPPEVITLQSRFATIHRLALESVIKVMRLLEEDHQDLLKIYGQPRDLYGSPIRLIFYHKDQGPVLAGGHFDKSSLTQQIAESHVGLRVRNPHTKEMEYVRRSPNKSVLFPGVLLPKMFPDTELTPAWHDVTNNDELNEGRNIVRGRNCARWALIWFSNVQGLEVPRKQDTHTETSEKSQAA